jgi:hypothetical protein
MEAVALLVLWATALCVRRRDVGAAFLVIAIGFLCLQAYWLGTGVRRPIEFISCLGTTFLGICLGLSLKSKASNQR